LPEIVKRLEDSDLLMSIPNIDLEVDREYHDRITIEAYEATLHERVDSIEVLSDGFSSLDGIEATPFGLRPFWSRKGNERRQGDRRDFPDFLDYGRFGPDTLMSVNCDSAKELQAHC
jgi:hypothetical protein